MPAINVLKQFRDGLAFLQDRDGPAGAVVIKVMRIDAEAMVDRGEQAVAVHGPLRRLLAARVGSADHLAHAQAAAGEQHAHGPWPMVAAGPAAGVLILDAR